MHLVSKYIQNHEVLKLANSSCIDILGRGCMGIFERLANVANLTTPLISTKVLVYLPFYYIILHIDERNSLYNR